MSRQVANILIGVVTAVVVTAPAFAGSIPAATPLPVVGLGIPALALFGLAYRRLRNRGKN